MPLDSGRAECGGRTVSLLELGAGFGPDFSGRENIFLNGALHGFGREEIEERVDDDRRLLRARRVHRRAGARPTASGMQLRLGFSIVAHLDADVMLIDEILAVGDESFQRKCLARISERMAAGATLVLVSHDPSGDRARLPARGGARRRQGGLRRRHRRRAAVLPPAAGHRRGARRGRCAPSRERAQLESPSWSCVDAGGPPAGRLPHRRGAGRADERARAGARRARGGGARGARPARRGLLSHRRHGRRDRGRDRGVVRGAAPGPARRRLRPGGGRLRPGRAASGLAGPVARFSVAQTTDGEGVADLRGTWTLVGRREAVR